MGIFNRQRLYPFIFKLQRMHKEQFLFLKIKFFLKIKGLKIIINFKFLKRRNIFHVPHEKNYVDKNLVSTKMKPE